MSNPCCEPQAAGSLPTQSAAGQMKKIVIASRFTGGGGAVMSHSGWDMPERGRHIYCGEDKTRRRIGQVCGRRRRDLPEMWEGFWEQRRRSQQAPHIRPAGAIVFRTPTLEVTKHVPSKRCKKSRKEKLQKRRQENIKKGQIQYYAYIFLVGRTNKT